MPKIFEDKGKGEFTDMSSPLNAQVPSKDPRAQVAKNTPFSVGKPKDVLGVIPGGE